MTALRNHPQIEMRAIASLRPYPGNARSGSVDAFRGFILEI